MIRKAAAAKRMFQKWKTAHKYAAVTKKQKIVLATWARLKLLCVLRSACSTDNLSDNAHHFANVLDMRVSGSCAALLASRYICGRNSFGSRDASNSANFVACSSVHSGLRVESAIDLTND